MSLNHETRRENLEKLNRRQLDCAVAVLTKTLAKENRDNQTIESENREIRNEIHCMKKLTQDRQKKLEVSSEKIKCFAFVS